MQANSINQSFYQQADPMLNVGVDRVATDTVLGGDGSSTAAEARPSTFHGCFENHMEMYASADVVAAYLDQHHQWFRRCAKPMSAEPLGENGYALTIGKFKSFGYEVEPKIGLDLLPQDKGVYRIQTISIPGYTPPGYDVDFRASLQLAEDTSNVDNSSGDASRAVTNVEWELDLKVMIHFPRFIHALPNSLIQATGDRLLHQIVRQVSKRLTYKVQEDFHKTMGIPFEKPRRAFWK
ncbi:MAG: DUF1997 domain-containing protein [Leptolyngbyaceae bacterium]|nr:DUF1997 domain-containing protein [Leptolyngbyaceae bacterium]